MAFLENYIESKFDTSKRKIIHPLLNNVLAETYGVLVYQEQFMTAVNILAGYTFGKADVLRRTLGKRKAETILPFKADFIKRIISRNGISQSEAEDIFKELEHCAMYSFNKSHAVALAMLSYRMAYLKANYRKQFDKVMRKNIKQNTMHETDFISEKISLGEIFKTSEWQKSNALFPIALGRDTQGNLIIADLKKMCHVLIGDVSNSGKKMCIHNIINSLLYKCKLEDLNFVIYDSKSNLSIYNNIAHMLEPIVTDASEFLPTLTWLLDEMIKRYNVFKKNNVKNIVDFNETNPKTKIPYIVCIIDEIADLMEVQPKETEGCIARLTQLGRSAGIHVVIGTQYINAKVITNYMVNNIPTRIAFKKNSKTANRRILDGNGAELLIDEGDMLFLNGGEATPISIQSVYISDEVLKQ